ncbi:enoyl-CoA hydratase/isomerase family protein [Nocardiopsis ansamitocini]|uniref:Enoyl-CoA hydratase n=1 Tax=Nocardiopsis ansamitocini TaxID=1670832 RepID=A0A9W6UJQ4_9ACTN|nr:enoyl-CoA hydratase-related protein [Nocardiopsis ansamitocini]GLU48753.1 enoyl-CoA hydratase [Nocardiopsis ansamitocini]
MPAEGPAAAGSAAGDAAGFSVARRGPVATLVIDRPAKRNALTMAMWEALPEVLAGLDADPGVSVLVLTGAGAHFCAGADIPGLPEDTALFERVNSTAEAALADFAKPTVAMVRGACVGGGCELAVACDLRFAASSARFAITASRLGLVYPPGPTRRLVSLVGAAPARYLLYSSLPIGADHAHRIGLVDVVVEDDALEAAVAEFTDTLAARSQLSVRAAKAIIGEADPSPEWRSAAAGAELAEGKRAFTERREPRFAWR